MRRELLLLCCLVASAAGGLPSFLGRTECPDPHFSCPSASTCCELRDHTYGCCPKRNAVCCSDHLHCCDEGMTCDLEAGACRHKNGQTAPLQKKHVALQKQQPVQEAICPDQKAKCPAGSTCCLLSMGSYGCCPLPEAVCCPDRMHCCPNGYHCDAAGERCLEHLNMDDDALCEDDADCPRGLQCRFACAGSTCARICGPPGKERMMTPKSMTWFKKFAATSIRPKEGIEFTVEEEDFVETAPQESESDEQEEALTLCGKIRCPTASTCCAVEGLFGQITYRCCPLTDGVCCANYCCPAGFHCTSDGRCEKSAHNRTFRLDTDY